MSSAPVEDSKIEFKSEFIEPAKAARRLAAHANASTYDSFIWVFGAREDGKVVGVDKANFASWFAQVARFFNGVPPRPKEVTFSVDDKTLMAVAFDPDAPPYVVSNPLGGSIGFEVPWREATTTRSANRAELLQVLVPQAKLPKIEVLAARVLFGRERQDYNNERYSATAQIHLYVAQLSLEPIALPTHRVRIEFSIGGNHELIRFDAPHFSGTNARRIGPVGSSPQPRASAHIDGIEATDHEAIIRGFGKLSLSGHVEGRWGPQFFAESCTLKVTCGLAGDHRAIVLACELRRVGNLEGPDFEWSYKGSIIS